MKDSKLTVGIVILALAGLLLSTFTFAPVEQKVDKPSATPIQSEMVSEEKKEEKVEEKTEVDLVKRVEYGIEVGMKAPELKLKTLDGKEVALSQLKGKKVILNFFASWCPYCQAEAGDLERIYKEYKDENVLLAKAKNAEQAYIEEVLPAKLRYYERYVTERSFWEDLKLIFLTLNIILTTSPIIIQ